MIPNFPFKSIKIVTTHLLHFDSRLNIVHFYNSHGLFCLGKPATADKELKHVKKKDSQAFRHDTKHSQMQRFKATHQLYVTKLVIR